MLAPPGYLGRAHEEAFRWALAGGHLSCWTSCVSCNNGLGGWRRCAILHGLERWFNFARGCGVPTTTGAPRAPTPHATARSRLRGQRVAVSTPHERVQTLLRRVVAQERESEGSLAERARPPLDPRLQNPAPQERNSKSGAPQERNNSVPQTETSLELQHFMKISP